MFGNEAYEVRMYIPAEPEDEFLDLQDALLDVLPGLTTVSADGAWVEENFGSLIEEPVNILIAVVQEELLSTIDAILLEYKKAAAQQAVLYTITPTHAVLI